MKQEIKNELMNQNPIRSNLDNNFTFQQEFEDSLTP